MASINFVISHDLRQFVHETNKETNLIILHDLWLTWIGNSQKYYCQCWTLAGRGQEQFSQLWLSIFENINWNVSCLLRLLFSCSKDCGVVKAARLLSSSTTKTNLLTSLRSYICSHFNWSELGSAGWKIDKTQMNVKCSKESSLFIPNIWWR